jgi:hypothetical protein
MFFVSLYPSLYIMKVGLSSKSRAVCWDICLCGVSFGVFSSAACFVSFDHRGLCWQAALLLSVRHSQHFIGGDLRSMNGATVILVGVMSAPLRCVRPPPT